MRKKQEARGREAEKQRSREAERQRGRNMEEDKFEKKQVRTYRDLNVYQLSFELAMNVYRITKDFPSEERYSLVDQMRRSARSIPANLAEGWAKRKYENVFKRHLYDCIGSCEEIKVWLEFALKCSYLDENRYEDLRGKYAEVGAMLSSLVDKWQTF